jgi:hypothetical protein
VRLSPCRKFPPLPSVVVAHPYTASQISLKLKLEEAGIAWSCGSDGGFGHPNTQGAGEPRLGEVGTLDVVGQACLCNLSSELSLERFFGAGIINEVLLARHFQALTIPVI